MIPGGIVIKAIILAAGRGSRLGLATETIPKCLVEVQGIRLIDRQLEALTSAGISKKNIAIVTGYKKEILEEYKFKKFYNQSWESTNIVYSLTKAREWLETEVCIISYSDIFYSDTAIKILMRNSDELAITYDKKWLDLWRKRFKNPLDDAECFQLNQDSTLKDIGDSTDSIEQIQGQYMGLIKITPRGWTHIANALDTLDSNSYKKLSMTSLLNILIGIGQIKIRALPYDEGWGEIDSESDLSLFNNDPELKINHKF